MSELSKRVNKFFDEAVKSDIENLLSNIYVSEHLKKVLIMKYVEEKDIDFIAYETGYSKGKIEADLRKIRKKISKLI